MKSAWTVTFTDGEVVTYQKSEGWQLVVDGSHGERYVIWVKNGIAVCIPFTSVRKIVSHP